MRPGLRARLGQLLTKPLKFRLKQVVLLGRIRRRYKLPDLQVRLLPETSLKPNRQGPRHAELVEGFAAGRHAFVRNLIPRPTEVVEEVRYLSWQDPPVL